jgi:hypothetical protein
MHPYEHENGTVIVLEASKAVLRRTRGCAAAWRCSAAPGAACPPAAPHSASCPSTCPHASWPRPGRCTKYIHTHTVSDIPSTSNAAMVAPFAELQLLVERVHDVPIPRPHEQQVLHRQLQHAHHGPRVEIPRRRRRRRPRQPCERQVQRQRLEPRRVAAPHHICQVQRAQHAPVDRVAALAPDKARRAARHPALCGASGGRSCLVSALSGGCSSLVLRFSPYPRDPIG